ncbi:MAG: HDIG domain-containing protein [Deltaproteobacteria bacterium]|nr:HDIG domain-containing protein [Deltaproteobacteria bacterium]
MDREAALTAIRENVKNENLIKHMFAAEAIMRALARRFNENEDEWGLAGLLHDIDVELTNADLSVHSKHGAEMAKQLGAGEVVCHAILVHNGAHGVPCESLMDKALYCADPLTGLITAGALVRPDKKLAGVEAKSIRKRFKEERFAAGANREQIATCSGIGLDLDAFIELGLEAMKGVAEDLGL